MNKLNKRTISKLVLIIFMISMVTFLTSCTFSSSMLGEGVNELANGFRGLFNAIINGLVAVIIGIGEGLWNLIVGIFYLLVGAIAWLWELIVSLF